MKSTRTRLVLGSHMQAIINLRAKIPEQGQLVSVRHRQYVVANVQKSVLFPSPLHVFADDQNIVTLSSIEDDALGEELQVVWEIEPDARVFEQTMLPDAEGFDAPDKLDAFLNAVRWGAASSADYRTLQAPFRSGIDIEDYQLDPLVRAIQMPRVNLLIADDVGLGKTIEAGLVLQELVTRHRVRTALILCPAHLQIHWKDQMREKFGLEFRIVDSKLRHDLRRSRGLHVNPWTHFPRLITSMDYLKRERPLRLFREALPVEGEAVYPRRFDMLIVDEAHNVAPSGRGKYARDSQRTSSLRLLVPHFEHKLFLTATPHNGFQESFTALLELLDNQRFSRGIPPDRNQLHQVMVRRLKSELQGWSGAPRFPQRKLEALEVEYSDEERELHSTLESYSKSRLQGAAGGTEKLATEFVLKTLKKRLFSSPAAFLITINRHEFTIRNSVTKSASLSSPSIGILQEQIARVDEDTDNDEEFEQINDDAIEATSRFFHELTSEESRLIKQMKELAERLSSRLDGKTKELLRWLTRIIKPEGKWSDERVIIFTEYRATQKWLQTILTAQKFAEGERLSTLFGGMDTDFREKVKNAFQAPPGRSSVRILLATDAASEGIDLQNYCHRLIHFEIPWNPNRLEQRNGRIDRHGQNAPDVQIFHFVGKGFRERLKEFDQGNLQSIRTGNLEGDIEFLMVAARKVENIRNDLGKVGPVIARQVEEAMLGRRSSLNTTVAESESKPIREMLKFERKLQEEITKLHERLVETQHELSLSPENIQSVVEVALALAGQPPLRETSVSGVWPDPTGRRTCCPVFHLPHLTGSWSLCAEGLADPHTKEIRPIVFDHTILKQTQDVVLCHLNHRLVTMSLRLLRAEVWSRTGRKLLHRMTARLVPNNILASPALIAHARLVVVGGDSHRLHEEVITVGGRIHEGRFRRLNVGEVQSALESATAHGPSDTVKAQLIELWPTHLDTLRTALDNRMETRFESLKKSLVEREEKEAGDIRTILTELKRKIEEGLEIYRKPEQLDWVRDLDTAERDQFDRDVDNLRARIRQIPNEIEDEVKHIRERFASPTPRLFPVAVTWLVPEKFAL